MKNEQDLDVRRHVRMEDVEAAVPEALGHGALFFADIDRNQVDETGRAVLRFLAVQGQAGSVVNREAVTQQFPGTAEQALTQLMRRELIEKKDDGYRVQVEMIRRWFSRESQM